MGEGVHGTMRMLGLYNIGVISGAGVALALEAHLPVVGMSGGCYTLLGMHAADLLMNWRQKRYRKPTLLVIVILAAADIVVYNFSQSGSVSHGAHLGGYIAGTVFGILIGKNYKLERGERRLMAVALVIGVALLAFILIWTLAQWAPRDIFDDQPWCWVRQVVVDGRYECVRCADSDCIERSSQYTIAGQQGSILLVDINVCMERGFVDPPW